MAGGSGEEEHGLSDCRGITAAWAGVASGAVNEFVCGASLWTA